MKKFNQQEALKNLSLFVNKVIIETPALLTQLEGEFLFKVAKTSRAPGDIVEIGSFLGGSTILLASGALAGKSQAVYAVDPCIFWEKWRNFSWLKSISKNAKPEELFWRNVNSADGKDLIRHLKMKSRRAARRHRGKISTLFIDGDHRYHEVLRDFVLWEKKLSVGGIIAFHDSVYPIESEVASLGRQHHYFKGPKLVVEKVLKQSSRFDKISTVDSITFAQKVSNRNLVQAMHCQLLFFCANFSFLRKELEGRIGIFLKHTSPRLYKFMLKFKNHEYGK